ncbi:hypothetical protein PUNSTDRAFT_144022 [Punctularia strigosozonata HHB-11173 SS5]|uniref:uncharacterized protein n=1 Tax=Punctularia strigosozonata (strain HHB-11173) TaxID=741275 RepID=UPI0004417613|nr:uncharacterized protein PUNSTDRAFT_144022 [Punctularia strigosozonata HHB-11173 SS5]EIN08423.1 hypothetical protein PUNSTDRAFT_144022 [Punctularia strigosozonata HHB-11173 SS5]
MPPLPTSFDEETVAVIDSLGRRQRDISTFQIPRLRDCNDALLVQQQLAAELRDDIERYARDVESLEASVPDQRGDVNRRALSSTVQSFKDELIKMRKEFRAAILASKRRIDARNQLNREELLKSSVLEEKQTERAADDALMRANNNVTEALRRTVGLMQGELEKSVLSHQMLEESSANLRLTSTAHDTLSFIMGTSKQLITALEKSDWLDRMLILSGLLFFLLVVLFILKQRILDRGLRLALWWTRFLPSDSGWKSVEQELVQAERGEFTELTTAITTIVGSVTSLASALSTAVESVGSDASSALLHSTTDTSSLTRTIGVADLPSTPRDEL